MSENELERKFNKYISKIKKLESVSNDDKLYLYANYKQALIGNINVEKPSLLNRVEMEKWKAWSNIKDTSKEECVKNYIKKVKAIYTSLGLK